MKRSYENTLKVIYQGDPDLAELIRGYIEKFPKAISDKMAAYKPKGVGPKQQLLVSLTLQSKSLFYSVISPCNCCKDFTSPLPCALI